MDLTAVASGLAISLLGALLVLDQAGTISLGFEWAAPAVLGVVGVVLLAAGLEGPRRR